MPTELCLTLCDPMDCSPPGSSVHGIFQARILQWVAMSYSRESSQHRIEPTSAVSPALRGRFFNHCTTWEAQPLPRQKLIISGLEKQSFSLTPIWEWDFRWVDQTLAQSTRANRRCLFSKSEAIFFGRI